MIHKTIISYLKWIEDNNDDNSCDDDIEIHVLTDAQFLFAVLWLSIRKVWTGGKHAILLRVYNEDDKHAKPHDDEDDKDEMLLSAKISLKPYWPKNKN